MVMREVICYSLRGVMEICRLSKQYHFKHLSNRGLLRITVILTGVGIVSGEHRPI